MRTYSFCVLKRTELGEAPRTTIIVPDLDYSFELDAPSHEIIRDKIKTFLHQFPYRFQPTQLTRPTHWVLKIENEVERDWLYDSNSSIGIMVEINEQELHVSLNVAALVVTIIFLLCIAANAYFEALMTAVNIPGNEDKQSLKIAYVSTVNDIFQDIAQFFALQTPAHVTWLSKKITNPCRKKTYHLKDDFIIPTILSRLKKSLCDRPGYTIGTGVFGVTAVSSTLFSAVMMNLTYYKLFMNSMEEAHKKELTHMNLHLLLTLATIVYIADASFETLMKIQQFVLASKAGIWAYNAAGKMIKKCFNHQTSTEAVPLNGEGMFPAYSPLI